MGGEDSQPVATLTPQARPHEAGLWALSALDKEGKHTLSAVDVWETGSTAAGEHVTCHLIGPFLCMGGAQDFDGMWEQAAAMGGQTWVFAGSSC